MLNVRRQNRETSAGPGRVLANVGPRLRLFGLLALMVPLFLGLQYFVQDSVPQIEVRFITPDSPSAQAPTERVVERVVYVPVDRNETAAMSEPVSPAPQVATSQAT